MIEYFAQGTRLVRLALIVVERICKLKHWQGGRLHVEVGAHAAEGKRSRCSARAVRKRYGLLRKPIPGLADDY